MKAYIFTILESQVNLGKNASVLLTIAKAINDNKTLPTWANKIGKAHFQAVFAKSEKQFSQVAARDSYAQLRTILNAKELNSTLYSLAKDLLTVQAFQNLDCLKKVVEQFEAKQLASHLFTILGKVDTTVTGRELDGLTNEPPVEPPAPVEPAAPQEISDLKLNADEVLQALLLLSPADQAKVLDLYQVTMMEKAI